jgi:acetyltransferase-like isoleucine patch superfamily enzyme
MFDNLILQIKRGESGPFRLIKRTIQIILYSSFPVPSALRPAARLAYQLHFGAFFAFRWAVNFFYNGPIFQARCESVGKNLHVWLLPEVRGPIQIYLGDNVNLFGAALIESTLLCGERPKLVVGNRVDLGHNLRFVINRSVVIEDDVRIASSVRIIDTDDFPADPVARKNRLGLSPEDSKPIHIGRYAWIGQSSFIMKGVTIGEGAIIGVNSVVVNDVPEYCVAMGNPARVVQKNVGRPAAEASTPAVGNPDAS